MISAPGTARSAAIARCDQEIGEIYNRPDFSSCPSWLLTMGIMDWTVEKLLIEQEPE